MQNISLGDRVKDNVTSFSGIVVAQSDYLNGCTRFCVQSEKLKDGLPTDGQWFDGPQLRLVKAGVVPLGGRNTGGPLPFTPKRTADPRR